MKKRESRERNKRQMKRKGGREKGEKHRLKEEGEGDEEERID